MKGYFKVLLKAVAKKFWPFIGPRTRMLETEKWQVEIPLLNNDPPLFSVSSPDWRAPMFGREVITLVYRVFLDGRRLELGYGPESDVLIYRRGWSE